MSVTCDPAAEAVTGFLGFSCHDVNPVVSLNNPFGLYSWTMPILELLIIGGAIFALVHAVRRLRAESDPTNLALWFGSLVYLAVTEPPLYFPEWFGLDKIYGFIFAHNEFTVQFMYDRLPLYIVAFYPAITALAYEVVRGIGVFRRRGPLVGAVCVAFVCQVFYEIFDQLGPQLKWWAWNPDNMQVNHPMLASVPMTSMLLFASVSFGFLTYLVVRWVGVEGREGPPRSGLSVAGRTIAAGVLTPLGMVVAAIPFTLLGGDNPQHHGASLGSRHRARPRLARRRLVPRSRGTRRAAGRPGTSQQVCRDLPGRFSGRVRGAVAGLGAAVLRCGGRAYGSRNAHRQWAVRPGLLRRRHRGTGAAVQRSPGRAAAALPRSPRRAGTGVAHGYHGWNGDPPRTEELARQRIIDAASRCIERMGVPKTTLSNVAEEVGVTRQTVYRYFPSLAELLSAVAETGTADFIDRMQAHLAGADSPIDAVVESFVFTLHEIPVSRASGCSSKLTIRVCSGGVSPRRPPSILARACCAACPSTGAPLASATTTSRDSRRS